MRAEWLPEKAKAVVKQKTKSWEVFGHNSDNTDWLFPEEAVFLLELVNYFSKKSLQNSVIIIFRTFNPCSAANRYILRLDLGRNAVDEYILQTLFCNIELFVISTRSARVQQQVE